MFRYWVRRDDINIFNVSMKIINQSISFSVIFYPPFLFTNKNFSYFYVGKKKDSEYLIKNPSLCKSGNGPGLSEIYRFTRPFSFTKICFCLQQYRPRFIFLFLQHLKNFYDNFKINIFSRHCSAWAV